MLHTVNEGDAGAGSGAVAHDEELAREEAVKRIEHKRRFWISAAVSTGGLLRKPISESQISREIERHRRS